MPQNKKRSKRSTLVVNGVMVEVVTISGLAEIIGKSRNTILRYESTGVFPAAPIRKGQFRYYPISFAGKLAKIVEKLSLNKRPSPEVSVEINKLFKEERDKLCQR